MQIFRILLNLEYHDPKVLRTVMIISNPLSGYFVPEGLPSG